MTESTYYLQDGRKLMTLEDVPIPPVGTNIELRMDGRTIPLRVVDVRLNVGMFGAEVSAEYAIHTAPNGDPFKS